MHPKRLRWSRRLDPEFQNRPPTGPHSGPPLGPVLQTQTGPRPRPALRGAGPGRFPVSRSKAGRPPIPAPMELAPERLQELAALVLDVFPGATVRVVKVPHHPRPRLNPRSRIG